ncbi:MAG: indolepyruvate oxidoreductase subunit beta [Candidatus Kariarchaeaceae archaeon]
MSEKTNTEEINYQIVVCGVGGQGVLLLTDILANLATDQGIKVRGSETHGMSQRGGTVLCSIKIGPKAYSPLIMNGTADVLIALEKHEALRYSPLLKKDGWIIVNTKELLPQSWKIDKEAVEAARKSYEEDMHKITSNICFLDAEELAKEAGAVIAQNVVLLGALAACEDFPFTSEQVKETLKKVVKKRFVDLNLKAFENGFEKGISV